MIAQYVQQYSSQAFMNFLNFLTAGASIFNFNLQSLNTDSSKAQLLMGGEEGDPKAQLEAITQQQQVINQYMHMNLQLINQKLQTLGKNGDSSQRESNSKDQGSRTGPKKTKKINKCGHDDRQHYAKGMCNNCYHKFGRTKKPWNCPHEKLYAAGMCQNCYINNYNRKKREGRSIKDEAEPKIENEEVSDQQRFSFIPKEDSEQHESSEKKESEVSEKVDVEKVVLKKVQEDEE